MSTTASTALPTGTWNVDPTHSSVEFQVKHLGIATVKGQFTRFEGALTVAEDGTATARGTVDVASVDTRDDRRDEHLRSGDFFDAAAHPQLSFASTAIEVRDGGRFTITGDLTMRGVTKPITLEGEVTGSEVDPWGNERIGLTASGSLSRGEYGMTFNQALGSGNMLVSDTVKIALDVSAVKAA